MGLFNLFKAAIRPKKEPPDLSPAMRETISMTVGVCSRQIEQCFGQGITKLPYVSDHHDDVAATYALGFLQGTLLSNHADIAWAKGDRDLADVGWYICANAVIAGIFDLARQDEDTGYNRVMSCCGRLPQFKGQRAPDAWFKLEMAGGSDAMAFAKGEAMPKGGYLLIFLNGGLTPEQKAAATA